MQNFNELTKGWSTERKERVEKLVTKYKMEMELAEELETELAAAADYFERTGHNMFALDLVSQRKVIESYMEDHVYDKGGEGL